MFEIQSAIRDWGTLGPMLDAVIVLHPLPWSIKQDDRFRVIASDGAELGACRWEEEARTIIELAETRIEDQARGAIQLEFPLVSVLDILGDSGIDHDTDIPEFIRTLAN